ncbi:hypothetical protein KP509_31G034800 [Ceratopteris richardii]|uniref:50S ribosomal protein L18, chloroplastic n=1 Tax=Ceratopteris richardii TaxID=49495 RepID=A0A8T2QXP2_CERRI|nr:hypothetical protein KP509_31G034800 [Ceratopteris richardii]
MALLAPQQLSWSRNLSSWVSPSPCISPPRTGAEGRAPFQLRIESGAGKKRVPRTESDKVLNLRSIKKLTGTVKRPRLLVFCSDKHLYAQVIVDTTKATLVSASTARYNGTIEKESGSPILHAAKKLGEEVAMECFKMGVSTVLYYRRGTLHWERVRTFRLAVEEFGLNIEYPK